MITYIFEQKEATLCIVEMIGEHNVEHLDERVTNMRNSISIPFTYIACQVKDWNHDLSPWKCLSFGDGAKDTYEEVMTIVKKRSEKEFILAGYSLAGLFSLWVGYQTDFFTKIVACSPSVWFPEWDTFMENNIFLAKDVYLSLGSKEHKTKHPLMREVKKRILLTQEKLHCALEMNPGNHFQDVELRMLKAYQYITKEKA